MHGAYLGEADVASQPRGRHIRSIDLNADIGEHDGDRYRDDERLLSIVSSASIACGQHAGSATVMEETARRASSLGVAIGAHPSYPDREGFGRRDLDMPPEQLAETVSAQIETMLECAARAGARVNYVKPHGALYNRAMRDRELAESLVFCVISLNRDLVLLSLPHGELAAAARAAGVWAAREGFIDRAYDADGALVPRSETGAVIHDISYASQRALAMAARRPIDSIDGKPLHLAVDSLCVHSDSENAAAIVGAARKEIERAGFAVAPFA